MNTEMGKIANAITLAQDGKTPLEIKLEQLSKVLTKIVIGVCIFIFAFNVITKYFLGAPGAGKGTQAEVICKKLSIPPRRSGRRVFQDCA